MFEMQGTGMRRPIWRGVVYSRLYPDRAELAPSPETVSTASRSTPKPLPPYQHTYITTHTPDVSNRHPTAYNSYCSTIEEIVNMSASPAPSNGEQAQKSLEQITFRFCREWYVITSAISLFLLASDRWLIFNLSSNMLYPKEDRMRNTLMFACRTCQFSEPATSSCVFRNILHNSVGETAGVTQDVGSDPTVGLPIFCTLCGQEVGCPSCEGEL